MELTNKAAYLRGLMDGLDIDENSKEGKVFKAMADLLKEMAETIEDLAVEVDETVELVDTLDQDLGDVEEIVYDLDDDDDEDDDFEDCEYECVCPTCGDTIMLDESIVEEGSIDCPNCGEKLEFDFDEEEDEEE
ncbi:MAG: hypothetical protein IJR91_06755 [Ruminococcus sp.]|nr:hypothetical protein [Ruminococcus sp.]